MTSRVRFTIGVALVAVGAATFAVAFRASLSVLYRVAYRADNVVEAIAGLPPWLRLLVPVAGAESPESSRVCERRQPKASATSWKLLRLETSNSPFVQRRPASWPPGPRSRRDVDRPRGTAD